MLNIAKPIDVIKKYIGSITPSMPILKQYFILIVHTMSLIVPQINNLFYLTFLNT